VELYCIEREKRTTLKGKEGGRAEGGTEMKMNGRKAPEAGYYMRVEPSFFLSLHHRCVCECVRERVSVSGQ